MIKILSKLVIIFLFVWSFLFWQNISGIEEGVVKKVVDGDTIILENGETVRYIGIDTPEVSVPVTDLECYGPEATEFNMNLVEGKQVELERDIKNKDKYNRLLRYVYVDDKFVNLELVKNGYARRLDVYPNISQSRRISNIQNNSIINKVGLWSEDECDGNR